MVIRCSIGNELDLLEMIAFASIVCCSNKTRNKSKYLETNDKTTKKEKEKEEEEKKKKREAIQRSSGIRRRGREQSD